MSDLRVWNAFQKLLGAPKVSLLNFGASTKKANVFCLRAVQCTLTASISYDILMFHDLEIVKSLYYSYLLFIYL